MRITSLGCVALCIGCFLVSPAFAELQSGPATRRSPAPPPPASGTTEPDANADNGADPESAPAAPVKQEYQGHAFKLWDGSRIVGRPEIETIVVHTDYGTLNVPSRAVVRIVPGLRNRPEYAGQIEQWINNLSHEQFPKREKAQQQLLKQGPAIRNLLESHRHSNDAERQHRIQKILAEFNELEIERDKMGERMVEPIIEDDRVVTSTFTIVGRVDLKEMKVAAGFGSVTLAFANLSEMALVRTGREPVQKQFTITFQDQAGAADKNTGIRLQRGDRVIISASGQITMSAWSSSYKSTPEGLSNCGWYKNNEIYYGALTGRVGSGNVFKVGTRHNFTAERPGLLKLGFAITSNYTNNRAFPGQYEVRVRVVPAETGE